MKLAAFDCDNTLWSLPSGVNLSDRYPTDDVGCPDFSFKAVANSPFVVERDDGALFELRPEARQVFEALQRQGVLVGIVTYNHRGNVVRILEAFGLLDLVDYIVAEFHTNKDQMIARMVEMARHDGYNITPADVVLVDDDPWKIYREQCRQLGAGFAGFGTELRDLRGVLKLVNSGSARPVPA